MRGVLEHQQLGTRLRRNGRRGAAETSPVDAVSARGFGETAACVVFVEASAFSSRAIEANASGLSSCSRSSRLSGLRLCSVSGSYDLSHP